jgi:uracil-DNA glycosylase
MLMDTPKSLASPEERAARTTLLAAPHVDGLVSLVADMRRAKGADYSIPDFDPLDGGQEAEVLFLLEAPGAKAVATGFISRNNPDETARNFFLLNAEAGIDRRLTVTWNAVPWYIGSGRKIRPATRYDVQEADAWLRQLLGRLHRLKYVMFVGQKSLHAQPVVRGCRPDVELMSMPHPSPLFINRAPGNRARVLTELKALARRLTVA